MKIVKLVILWLLILMSLAAGAAKVMQMPQEVKFFQNVGLSLGFLIPLGAFQMAGGLLGAIPKTRKYGAVMMTLAFVASAIMVFMSGNISFGLISLIPAALAGALLLDRAGDTP